MKKHRILFLAIVVVLVARRAYQKEQEAAMAPVVNPGVHVGPITPEPIPVQAANLSGVGTEPFRAFHLSGDTLMWDSPEWSGSFTGINYVGISGGVALYANSGQNIKIMTMSGTCSDGMSTNNYPASVQVLLSGNTYSGCIK